MVKGERSNATSTINSPLQAFKVLLILLLVASLWGLSGCQDSAASHEPVATKASQPSAMHEDEHLDLHPAGTAETENLDNPTAEQEPSPESASEPGMLGKAGELLKKATTHGGQTARGAGRWVQDTLGGATATGEKTAEETWAWANETFESLKAQGLTTASDTSQWLGQDWSNMESWEYKIVTLSDSDEGLAKTLNELGKQGWECFETESKSDGIRFFFKKPTFSYLRQMPFKDFIKLVPLINNGEK